MVNLQVKEGETSTSARAITPVSIFKLLSLAT